MIIQNQSARVRHEILLCLNGGIDNKQKIYTIVSEKTNAPRPTVRRVASALKVELQNHLDILSAKSLVYNQVTYNCTECSTELKRKHIRCPKCKILIDWIGIDD